MPEQDNWKERFDEKFTGTFAWIVMNCKDEIIQGIDINHLHAIMKEHIESLLSSQAHALKEQMKEALLDKFDEENDGITIMRGDILSAIESIEI